MDIQTIREAFEKEGYTLLTDKYESQAQKLDYICPNNHKRHTTWKSWKRGSRCLICKNQSTKPSFDVLKESFEKEGYILLSTEYINNKTKLDYICSQGHKNAITWADWNTGGYRCPDCANNKKLSIEKVISDFNSEGYTFIKGEYINNTSILTVSCEKGHEFETSRVRWTSGNRCPTCYVERVNIESIRESFADEGYRLLTEQYEDAHTKLSYICPVGHRHHISWAAWKQGERCYYCYRESRRTPIDIVKGVLGGINCRLIEDSYYNNDFFEYFCPEGHICRAYNLSVIKNSGIKCPSCYGNIKLTFEYVKSEIELEGYKVLSSTDSYFNNRTKLHLQCPNKHDYIVSWFDWNSNKVRCYKCKERGSSLQEQELIDVIKLWGVNIEVHDRYIIKPKELDIVIPDKKIAIEYCGLYWHSELNGGKDRNYHLDKLNICKDSGYKLITIFEDEWVNNKEIVLSRLSNILGVKEGTTKLYARQTVIRELNTQEASIFCEENHLQGYAGANIKLGAFYKDKLVSVMTFSKPSLSKGQKYKNVGIWELSRFCSKINYNIVGIASKLLSYFKNRYEWTQVFSYADKRWSIGNLYEKVGFDFAGNTKPNYWYFKKGDINRIHRFALRKASDEPKDITEWELRKAQDLDRIWDCGSKKYIMYNKEKEL